MAGPDSKIFFTRLWWSAQISGEFVNKNILHVSARPEEAAAKFGKAIQAVEPIVRRSREKLFALRVQRPRPLRDDKVITAWNGLMISAFATGYQVLRDETYLKAAEHAASFVAKKLYDPRARLLKRRYRAGEAAINGFVDDYSFFIQGLLDLYETSLDSRWLLLALDLTETQNRLFWDRREGGLSVADSWIAATALAYQAVLVHQDPEFRRFTEIPQQFLED